MQGSKRKLFPTRKSRVRQQVLILLLPFYPVLVCGSPSLYKNAGENIAGKEEEEEEEDWEPQPKKSRVRKRKKEKPAAAPSKESKLPLEWNRCTFTCDMCGFSKRSYDLFSRHRNSEHKVRRESLGFSFHRINRTDLIFLKKSLFPSGLCYYFLRVQYY